MRAIKAIRAFSVIFFVCSLILYLTITIYNSRQSFAPQLHADSDEITVSVTDDRSAWQEGITVGLGGSNQLNDRIQLANMGKMSADGALPVTYSVTDDQGRTATVVRKIYFSDYTPPAFELLKTPEMTVGSAFKVDEMVKVTDVLDGDITHLVKINNMNLDVGKAGDYVVYLTVENSYGVIVNYKLPITVVE